MGDWQEFSQKKIIEVRQRIQTIVVYEELPRLQDNATGEWYDGDPNREEAVVDSFDRPMQAQYT